MCARTMFKDWSMHPMRGSAIGLLAIVLGVSVYAQTASPPDSNVSVRGHVVADVASLAFGAGLGPKWTKFIVSVEQPDGPKLVLIAYAFYQDDQLPPDSFWNYANTYSMKLRRERTCDATVGEISFEENVDTNGTALQASSTPRFTKGSPIQTLDPALRLPCHVLWYRDYEPEKPDSTK